MRYIVLSLLLLTGPVFADDAPSLSVHDPVLFKSFEKARAAAAYLTIMNEGAEADMLVGVQIDGYMAMIHQSVEQDGVMRMMHVDAIEVPSGGMVEFAPGGLHVMVMGLKPGDLPLGSTEEMTLIFDRAGEMSLSFPVTDAAPAAGGHSGHGMTN